MPHLWIIKITPPGRPKSDPLFFVDKNHKPITWQTRQAAEAVAFTLREFFYDCYEVVQLTLDN